MPSFSNVRTDAGIGTHDFQFEYTFSAQRGVEKASCIDHMILAIRYRGHRAPSYTHEITPLGA